MKTIMLELKTSTDENIVQDIINKFKVIDDTKDRYDSLRFVTIKDKDVNIDLNGITVVISSISKPHIFVSIYKKFVYAVEVFLWSRNVTRMESKLNPIPIS